MTSTLERTFEYTLRALAPELPEPEREYRFAPPRRWRFDVAYPAYKVALELDGGTYMQGRHTRGAGYAADCEKMNTATVLGWRVLRVTGDMLNQNPGAIIAQLRELLTQERVK